MEGAGLGATPGKDTSFKKHPAAPWRSVVSNTGFKTMDF